MKRYKKILLFLISFIFIVIFILPNLLSPFITSKIEHIVSKSEKCNLQIGSIIINPLTGSISIKDIYFYTFLNNQSVLTLHTQKAYLNLSVSKLFKKNIYISNIYIQKPLFKIVKQNSKSNLDILINKNRIPSQTDQTKFDFHINSVAINNGSFTYKELHEHKTKTTTLKKIYIKISPHIHPTTHFNNILDKKIILNAQINNFKQSYIQINANYNSKDIFSFTASVFAEHIPLAYFAQYLENPDIVKNGFAQLQGYGYCKNNILQLKCNTIISDLAIDLKAQQKTNIFSLPSGLVSEFFKINKKSINTQFAIEGPIDKPEFNFENIIIPAITSSIGDAILRTIKNSPDLLTQIMRESSTANA